MTTAFMKKRPRITKLAELTLASGGATSGDTKSTSINVRTHKEGTFFIRHTGLVGPTKTLNVTVVSKDPSGDFWEDLFSFTEITAAGTPGGEKKDVAANMGAELAIEWVKGSATIVTTFTVYGVFK